MPEAGDDDDTPRITRRARSHWGDTERAEVGRGHRRDQLAELEDAVGVPEPRAEADDTKPLHLTTLGELEIWERIDRLKDSVRRGHKDTGDQILAAMGDRPPNERLATLETRVRITSGILAAIGIIALGSVIATGTVLYQRGEAAGEVEQRLKTLEQRADHDEARLDQLERALYSTRRGAEQDRAAPLQPRTLP